MPESLEMPSASSSFPLACAIENKLLSVLNKKCGLICERRNLFSVQLSTENKFLRSQINPHFLFNTLNNLFSMAQAKGNDELADGISKLSGMMRYMLYDSNAESVPLNKEIAYLEDCITLK